MCETIGYIAMVLVIGAWFAIGAIGKHLERKHSNHGV